MHSATNLTTNELIIIFAKVSNNVNNIAMTAADEIRLEERENNTFNFVKNLLKKGYDASFIAEMTELSVKKVQELIKKIKESN